jgi:uncharacterized cofD-like protein
MKESKLQIWKDRLRGAARWLRPGLGVKRWVFIIFVGITLVAVGSAMLLLDVYRRAPDSWWLPIISMASLRAFPRLIRVLIFGSIGTGIIIWGLVGLNKSLLGPFLRPGHRIVDRLERHQSRKHGPKIVAIGGGHGLAALLRGLKTVSRNIYAVVTVADDGGSSGKLRDTLGILPPGDVRNCLTALSDDEDLLTHLFQYRFPTSNGSLQGHSFGNLFISSLVEVTGSFEEAVAESGKVLAVGGKVLPSTLENVTLVADIEKDDGSTEMVEGESRIPEAIGRIRKVALKPEHPAPYPEVIQAILSSDLVIIGPGSLYTSILPNLLVNDIAAALRTTQALKIYVCNLATQEGETEGFSCGDHVRVLEQHLGQNLFDIVIVNDNSPEIYNPQVKPVVLDHDLAERYNVYSKDLVDRDHPWRHDSLKLTEALIDLLRERTGPLTV